MAKKLPNSRSIHGLRHGPKKLTKKSIRTRYVAIAVLSGLSRQREADSKPTPESIHAWSEEWHSEMFDPQLAEEVRRMCPAVIRSLQRARQNSSSAYFT